MTSFYPRSQVAKLLVILALCTAPLVAPPGDDGEPLVPGTPKAAQAGFPTIDIAQVFGHLSRFSQLLTTVNEVRKQVELYKDNFIKLADMAGVEGVEELFSPVTEVLDTVTPYMETLEGGVNVLMNQRDEFYEMTNGNESPGEKIDDMKKYTTEIAKDFVLEPGKTNDRLESVQNKIQTIRQDCLGKAKGRASMRQCMAQLQTLTTRQITNLEKALARQTALIAGQGLDSDAATQHRENVWEALKVDLRNNRLEYFLENDPSYARVPKRTY